MNLLGDLRPRAQVLRDTIAVLTQAKKDFSKFDKELDELDNKVINAQKNIVDNYELISSVESIKKLPEISISPNPFNDRTTVTLSDNINKEAHFRLIDLTGQVMQKGKFYNNELTLWRDDLTSGIYVLSIILADGETVSKRIVVL